MTLSLSMSILIKRLQHDTTAVVAIDRLAAHWDSPTGGREY